MKDNFVLSFLNEYFSNIPNGDKFFHFIFWFIFTKFLKNKIIIIVIISIVIEILQYYVGCSFEPLDIVFNCLGVITSKISNKNE